MKKFILTPILLLLTLSACDNKRDHNGDLGGMWQLTEWRSPEGTTLATKADQIFYSVQLNLIRFRDYDDGTLGDYYLAYFRHTPDSLIVYRLGPAHIDHAGTDTLIHEQLCRITSHIDHRA